MTAAYSIAFGHEKEHATIIKRGLAKLPTTFLAEVCFACKGEGAYDQMFTAGCGGGYYKSYSGCDWCDGLGLLQNGKPAAQSVLNQVLEAGKCR